MRPGRIDGELVTAPAETMGEQSPAHVPVLPVTMGEHYVRYSSSTILVIVAGLISYPTLTRLLDNTQYGILSYYDTWVVIAAAVVKLGGQHAILRFFPHGGDPARMTHFATNLVLFPMIVSLCIWSLGVLVLGAVAVWGRIAVSPVLWCAVMLLPLLVFTSQAAMTLRASERSGLLAVTQVSYRWLELILILAAVVAIQRSALAVYGAKIAVAVILTAFYVGWMRRHLTFSRAALDLSAYRQSLYYSLPLVVNEMTGAVLASIDRVMLKSMLGDYAAVGVYTIGSALALQVALILSGPLWAAFNPVANRIHDTEGPAQVRALKSRVLMPATYVSVGVGVAIWAVGADMLVILTGPTKAESGPVFMWLGTLLVLLPLLEIAGYGLLLQKRTKAVLALSMFAALANIALNVLWIPTYGVMGSVYASIGSYVLLHVGHCMVCSRELVQFPDAKTLLMAGASAAMFLMAVETTGLFGMMSPWAKVMVAGGLWSLFYFLPVMALDSRLRRLVFGRWMPV